MRRRFLVLLMVLGLMLIAAAPSAGAKATDNSPLQNFSDDSLVGKGAHTTLQRTADAVSDKIRSRNLIPGNAYTVWLVIFNDPSGCSDPCGENDLDDLTGDPSVIWSGAGGIANPAGNLNMSGYLSEGNPQGYQQLFTDLGVPDPGFVDAEGAEIHNIVRDHGPATGNPDQVSTFEGDCTPASSFGLGSGTYECEDVQFSIHMP